ncbi:MAG: hypothetical protein R6V49_04890, partial [Bacteroidales bacterium]
RATISNKRVTLCSIVLFLVMVCKFWLKIVKDGKIPKMEMNFFIFPGFSIEEEIIINSFISCLGYSGIS